MRQALQDRTGQTDGTDFCGRQTRQEHDAPLFGLVKGRPGRDLERDTVQAGNQHGGAMMTRVSVIIHGRVQGVAFRHYTCQEALELGVTGWVRNLPDGSVEGLFEGNEDAVAALVEWCRSG